MSASLVLPWLKAWVDPGCAGGARAGPGRTGCGRSRPFCRNVHHGSWVGHAGTHGPGHRGRLSVREQATTVVSWSRSRASCRRGSGPEWAGCSARLAAPLGPDETLSRRRNFVRDGVGSVLSSLTATGLRCILCEGTPARRSGHGAPKFQAGDHRRPGRHRHGTVAGEVSVRTHAAASGSDREHARMRGVSAR